MGKTKSSLTLSIFYKNELLNGHSLYFGKDIRQIGIVIAQLFADKMGMVYFGNFVRIMDQFNDKRLNAFNNNLPLIVL